jgi:acetyltransferase-like isoleucine patch superfamily enzyme
MIERFLPHDWFPRALPANVEVGERSWLYSSFSLVHLQSALPAGVRIGHDSGVYHGTFFDLGPDGDVVIGNYCTIVGAIFATNGRVEIGDYTFIAHEVVIADDVIAVPPNQVGQGPNELATVKRIGENVWIGARAVLIGNVQVGDGAVVGAAAVVNTDVAPYTVVVGNPARRVGTVPTSNVSNRRNHR